MTPRQSHHTGIGPGADRSRSGTFFARWAAPLLLLVSLAIYANTLTAGYVYDDGIVILDNRFTRAGLSGIPDIVSRDSFVGAFGESAALTGGRYRPLSIVTFAVEWQLFGENPVAGHAGNIILYGLTVLIFYMIAVRWLFPGHPWIAWLIALLFAVHPVHTEVVANIKSRDEILVLLFFLLALRSLLRRSDREGPALAAIGFFVLALFSKESAMTFPVLFAIGLWCLTPLDARAIAKRTWPFFVLAGLFFLLRSIIIGETPHTTPDVLDAPYLYATTGERLGSIAFVLGKYLDLIVRPIVLTYDYSFRQLPYRTFADPLVWLSLAAYVGLGIATILGLLRRRPFAFGFAIYLATIFIVSNLVVDIGAPMGERLAYIPSLGLLIALGAGAVRVGQGGRLAGMPSRIVIGVVIALAAAGAGKTVARNRAWQSNETLFLTDIQTTRNSTRTQRNAGYAHYERGRVTSDPTERGVLLGRATRHLERALEIHPRHVKALIDLGLAKLVGGDIGGADETWQRLGTIAPEEARLPQLRGLLVDAYGQRAAAFLNQGNEVAARRDWTRALELDPDDEAAQRGLAGLRGEDGTDDRR